MFKPCTSLVNTPIDARWLWSELPKTGNTFRTTFTDLAVMKANLVKSAALQGNIDFFRDKEISKGIKTNLSNMIVVAACSAPVHLYRNTIQILEWLWKRGYAIQFDTGISMIASWMGNVEIIKWAIRKKCMIHPCAACYAMLKGHTEIVTMISECI